jgi:hypothetical protein
MTNIEDFERFSVAIFDALSEAFPQEIALEVADFESEPDARVFANFVGTIEFLDQEGFIRCHGISEIGGVASNVKLTLKGLAVLRRVPDVLASRTTIGEQVSAASKSASKELMKAVVGEIVKFGVQLGSPGMLAQ